jgi:hypothetical protein
MKNIFKKITITNYFFDSISINIKYDLYYYLFDNLYIEDTLTWDLKTELIINANSEYI